MKNIFSKKIDTKRDHLAEFKTALSAAIAEAEKAGVRPGAIERELKSHASDFERAERARSDAIKFGMPVMRDPVTYKPINHGDPAWAEQRRNALELKRQQQEYQQALERAAERERLTR